MLLLLLILLLLRFDIAIARVLPRLERVVLGRVGGVSRTLLLEVDGWVGGVAGVGWCN